MTTVLALTRTDFEALRNALDANVETAFFGDVGLALDTDRSLFLLRDLREVPQDAYVERGPKRLVIDSKGFVPAISGALKSGRVPCFVHSHPRGEPEHSSLDDRVDVSLAEFVRSRSGEAIPYVSVVVGGTSAEPRLRARVVNEDNNFSAIDLIRIVGDGLTVLDAAANSSPSDWSFFDRQVRAFGAEGQRLLANLRIGVVGVGGTGSAVAEQLTRLGVGELLIADDDVVTDSNVSRIYGSSVSDVGAPKVQVVAQHLQSIGLATRIHAVVGRVTTPGVAKQFRTCDVVFGCTDDQWGRSILARLAFWYLLPVLDTGVVVRSEGGRVQEVIGRVTTVMPGSACLLCRGRIQPEAIAAEGLTPEERTRRQAEGYVPELGNRDPAVVTYTSLVASLATSELLNLLLTSGGGARTGTELLIRIDGRSIRGNVVPPRPRHFCDVSAGKWATGDADPFLDQLWT